jgi:hypothetical protein
MTNEILADVNHTHANAKKAGRSLGGLRFTLANIPSDWAKAQSPLLGQIRILATCGSGHHSDIAN